MTVELRVEHYVERWKTSAFRDVTSTPWEVVGDAVGIISDAIAGLGPDYALMDDFAVHQTAIVEAGAVLKGVGIIGPRSFVAAGTYLRDGVFLGDDCTVGPGSEMKASFMFSGSNLAHLNFVGDSIIGSRVNVEAGAILANYRNEFTDKTIRILHHGERIDTGVDKFGCLVGDDVRIGANAVIAPGGLIAPGNRIGRLQLHDQYPYQHIPNGPAQWS